MVGFEDGGDGGVGYGGVEGEGRGVGFHFGGAHAAALVGVEGDVVDFGGEAAGGGDWSRSKSWDSMTRCLPASG